MHWPAENERDDGRTVLLFDLHNPHGVSLRLFSPAQFTTAGLRGSGPYNLAIPVRWIGPGESIPLRFWSWDDGGALDRLERLTVDVPVVKIEEKSELLDDRVLPPIGVELTTEATSNEDGDVTHVRLDGELLNRANRTIYGPDVLVGYRVGGTESSGFAPGQLIGQGEAQVEQGRLPPGETTRFFHEWFEREDTPHPTLPHVGGYNLHIRASSLADSPDTEGGYGDVHTSYPEGLPATAIEFSAVPDIQRGPNVRIGGVVLNNMAAAVQDITVRLRFGDGEGDVTDLFVGDPTKEADFVVEGSALRSYTPPEEPIPFELTIEDGLSDCRFFDGRIYQFDATEVPDLPPPVDWLPGTEVILTRETRIDPGDGYSDRVLTGSVHPPRSVSPGSMEVHVVYAPDALSVPESHRVTEVEVEDGALVFEVQREYGPGSSDFIYAWVEPAGGAD